MKHLKKKYIKYIKDIVDNLSTKNFDYKYIVYCNEMQAHNIQQVVEDYEAAVNEKITVPPDDAFFDLLDIVEWEKDEISMTSVSFYLWFNDNRSDLCAEIIVEENEKQIIAYLDDILVP